ncbi:hydantoinase B/oxoprolinase family protein [Nocardioides acrostichi]|uniref:hydantoinase B/oxoprolinase family protein n=1 Tax=Nocardioides acrostichi TaxID=2784339 RepID=UPI001A9CAE69|nr:hydantoinase B/oxoprolinase family protein [Nocardioides acrostichi]
MAFPVPGSEVFTQRGLASREAVLAALPDSLELHQHDPSFDELDALTAEVVRHRLWATTERMGQALNRMSGSLVVTDCNDIGVVITNEIGDVVQVGPYSLSLATSIDLAIRWILEHRGPSGIRDGDMFLCNDPWIGGAIHQNDVAVIAPIFHDGKLFAWTASMAHQIDLGGASPGSWTPRAEDVFMESLPTPPVRIVRNFEIQDDVEDVYLRRSRMPKVVALDLRAKIGANRVGRERVLELVERYGADTVKATMARQLDDAEAKLRAKLALAPDGTWTASSFQEQSHTGDRNLHEVRCTLTKTGTEMHFDFTGTSPEAGMINCTYAGLHGALVAGIIMNLGHDIPWATGGMWRAITVTSEPGTLNNADFPAAVGKASVAASFCTINVVEECLSKMTDGSEGLHDHTTAKGCGTWDLCVLAGLDGAGQPFATMLTDAMGAGCGAGVDRDGTDSGGILSIPMGRMPDVEMMEFSAPILYLWRREETDTGGAGRYRGGVTASLAIIPHNTEVPMGQVVSGSGKAVSQNTGLAGGYPGNTQLDIAVREGELARVFAEGRIPAAVEEMGGTTEILSCEEETVLGPRDVHVMLWQGGGGYGDPVSRDPGLVVHDVAELRVSPQAAHDIYGVVLVDGELDEAGTTARREQIKNERREKAVAAR